MRAAAENLPWIAPHFGAISSDLSVYHRIDDVDRIGMPRFVRLLEHLHAYGGAYAQSIQRTQTQRSAATTAAEPGGAEGDTPPEEVARQWEAVLAREFPDHIAGGIETVSAEEMARMAGG